MQYLSGNLRDDLIFNNTIWDVKKTQQTIWQDFLDYARIVWDIACKNSDKATKCNDMLGLFWFHQEHP
jgi:hypothetical protein